MISDHHTHTPLCHHAEGTPAQYIDAALAAGLLEYGISDHAPHVPEPFDDWRMATADLPAYLDWVAAARHHAGDRLTVKVGLECDWLPGCEDHLETLRNYHDWDYLIGSVHYLPGPGGRKWDFDNPAHLSHWKNLTATELEDLWEHYWTTYTAMVRADFFDLCGHPDLIKKFAFTPPGDLRRYYEPTITALAETGKIFEINTAGWHKPCAEQYPARDFLALAAEAGIPVTINSDAHSPAEVARDFAQAHALAQEVGLQVRESL
ncbi:histidinol-phosphatase [Roseibacillus ishigakijimensis]|uniref:Histidinol-phosphatase n=1 Tax=Roseibacillus ishigakijimensis TaxID=454146 RepID=A0A934RS37_9BACT|nr:histidinol-phosphatase [Roseibacillus ishigakijimensis]MBK1834433.1 histidinol-phosphatase [Roseibacillus ishigakijimensis]